MPTIVRAELPTADAVILVGEQGQLVVLADVRVSDAMLEAVLVAARHHRESIPVQRAG